MRTANTKNVGLTVIMQTAKASDFDRRDGLEAGADYYLSKPFDESAFLLALQVTPPTISFAQFLYIESDAKSDLAFRSFYCIHWSLPMVFFESINWYEYVHSTTIASCI